MQKPIRRFTAITLENCELLILQISDLFNMKAEFPDIFA